MGLGFTISAGGDDYEFSKAGWSYGGFHSFRLRLAKELNLKTFPETIGKMTHNTWEDAEFDEPIEPLMNHSDCDGLLEPEECKKIAPRLRDLVRNWEDDDYDKANALILADDMEKCASAKLQLGFC